MYSYECMKCQLTSPPSLRRSRAEEIGAVHRDRAHEGMHPKGESILIDSARIPQGREWRPVLFVVAIILAALLSKVF